MVRHLGSLTDMMYVFDEPSVGLHPRDVHRLNDMLRKLRDKGNTVLVVEHDRDVIEIADHVVDVGPNAGTRGGKLSSRARLAAMQPRFYVNRAVYETFHADERTVPGTDRTDADCQCQSS